jgi:hypothetical protein
MGHYDTPCLNPAPTLPITVLDHNGIHKVAVRFCDCERALLSDKRIQCLRAGWYPATVTDPQTCATFRVLEEFHLLNLTGGLNVHDYIGALERRTDGSRTTLAPVRPQLCLILIFFTKCHLLPLCLGSLQSFQSYVPTMEFFEASKAGR